MSYCQCMKECNCYTFQIGECDYCEERKCKYCLEKGMHPNEKSKSKTPKRKPKKVPAKSNKAAVEKVQE